MTADEIKRRRSGLHAHTVAAERGLHFTGKELAVVPNADIDQTGRLVLGAAARAGNAGDADADVLAKRICNANSHLLCGFRRYRADRI